MDLNSITADIMFENSMIHSIETKCNMIEIPDYAEISFGLDIKYSKPIDVGEKKIGKLLLQIDSSIKESKDDVDCDTIRLVMEGIFSAKSSMDDSQFLELLNINGGAALYSIARAKIETISGLIYSSGKLLLPMINMIQFYQEMTKDG